MNDTRALVLKLLVAGVLVLFLFYVVVAAPAQQDITRLRQEVNTLEQACARNRSGLKQQPPLPEVEKAMWVHLDQLLAKRLYSQDNALSALERMTTLAHRCGARTLAGGVSAPPAPAPAARQVITPSGGRLLGDDLEETTGQRRGSAAQPAPARAPAPEVAGRNADEDMPTAFKRSGRIAETAPAKPVTRRLGGLEIAPHGLAMTLSGPYSAWPRFLNTLSWAVEPVLFQKMSARAVFVARADQGPHEGGGVLEIGFELPVVDQPREAAAALAAKAPPLAPSEDLTRTERLYLVDKFRQPLPESGPSTSTDPFPLAAAPNEAGAAAAFPKPTAFLKRNGAFVALINNKWMSVGERIGPYRILAITENEVSFSQ